jgi:Flp pilus assembly pilin Flp
VSLVRAFIRSESGAAVADYALVLSVLAGCVAAAYGASLHARYLAEAYGAR